MDGVAVRAYDVVQGMLGSPYVRAVQILCVAPEAIRQNGARRHQRESVRNRVLSAPRFDVCSRWTMAALAARALRRFRARRKTLEVRVLVEILENVGMASAADIASDVGRARCLCP